MTRLGFEGEPDAAAKKAQTSKKKPAVEAEATAEGEEAAPSECGEGGGGGKKKKKQDSKSVIIELTSRNKKKHVTAVRGLENFEVDVPAAAKLFGKKFACGSAFQKGKNGLPDQIEIQGNFMEELPSFLLDKFKIELDDIQLIEGKKKGTATAQEEGEEEA